MDRKTQLLHQKKMLERIAVCIHRNFFPDHQLPGDFYHEAVTEYKNGKIGNFQFNQCWNTAIEIYGLATESEMSDMIEEMEGEGIL